MYEEGKKFNFINFIIKMIIVIIFVLFTVWLVSLSNKGLSTSLDVLTDEIFADNIDKMKEVGKSYFTTERLPKEVGDKEKLTLEKMYDKHLILELKDKNGKTCSAEKSYVSIEKFDTEYQMKVYLECGDDSDYVIVIMGCYDYCDSDICELKTTSSEKVIEYEYKKETGGYWTGYGNWSEWSKTVVTKTDYREIETKAGTENYTYNVYASLIKNCPTGYTATADGTRCYKTTTSVVTANPTCPTLSGYTLASRNGFTCNYTAKVTAYADPICPTLSGYTFTGRSGFTCNYSRVVIASRNYVYVCNNTCAFQWVYTYKTETSSQNNATCPAGYNPSGNTCIAVTTSNKTATATCPTNYNVSGNICSRTISDTTYANYNYTCPAGYNKTSTGDKCFKKVTEVRDITLYRYRTRQYIGGSVDYKWSTSKNDTKLLNAGYKLTGKTRVK